MRSVRPSLECPEIPLYSVLEDSAERWGEKTAVINKDKEISFRELDERADRLATPLADMGVGKGDKVALFLPNSPEFIIGFFGTLKAGGVPTSMNPSYKEREVAHQYADSEAKVIIAHEQLYPVVKKAAEVVPIENVILVGERGVEGVHLFEELLESYRPNPPLLEIDVKEDLAALPYTSGTTGRPKGVMLTHYNLTVNWQQFREAVAVTNRATRLIFLPFYHIYGSMLMGGAISAGATQVLMERFTPLETLELIERYKPTILYVVPPALLALINVENLADYDLSSLNYIISAAAPLPKEVAELATQRTGVTVLQGYGLTETSPVTHCNPLDKIKLESIGIPMSDTEHKIVDLKTREDLGPGEIGELAIKGPQVMKGYWKRPEDTEEVFLGEWFLTGDVAKIDEENYAYIVDRAKDMIKYKGFSIGPAELEDVLFEHEAVADCAVIGKPDPEAGEIPKAFVVATGEVTAEELMEFVEERVAGYKKIREIEFVEAIPKSPSGKILKRELIERERGRGHHQK
jgi:long-chain acyl-CoA synthetase